MCKKCGCQNPWMGAGPDLRKVKEKSMPTEKPYWHDFDPNYKAATIAIHKAAQSIGWKDFTQSVLEYQREMRPDNPYNLSKNSQ